MVRCVDRGGSGSADFRAKSIVLHTWNTDVFNSSNAQPGWIERPENMSTANVGESALIDLVLEATETIDLIQSGGFTNAQFKVNIQVKELPA